MLVESGAIVKYIPCQPVVVEGRGEGACLPAHPPAGVR